MKYNHVRKVIYQNSNEVGLYSSFLLFHPLLTSLSRVMIFHDQKLHEFFD